MRKYGIPIASFLAVLLTALAQPAASQSYQFIKILDSSTQRPDGLGRFYIGLARTTPSYDGRWIVFRDPGPANDDGSHAAIWSFDTQDSVAPFHKLVDFNTPAPAGVGTFNNIQLTNAAPIVRNGVVVFLARDSAARQGLYSIPAGGGGITKIADQGTPDPSGGTFTVFDGWDRQMGTISFDGSTVAFNASGSTMVLGNYSVKPDGTALQSVADRPAMGGKIIGFYTPAISAGNIVMLGTDGHMIAQNYPGSNGYNGIYLGTPGGNTVVTELLNSSSPLPGDTNPNFSTRYDWPVLAFDGDLVVFRASDSRSGTLAYPRSHFGLYTTDLTSHNIRTIADVLSPPPGIPAGRLTSIADRGVAVSQGSVLYSAAAGTAAGPAGSALYLWRSGTSVRVVGAGDRIDNQTLVGFNEPGPAALSGSSFAFVADFGGLNQSLYLARPAAGTPVLAAVANSASNGGSAIAPGEIITLFGANMGPAALTHSSFINDRMPTAQAGVQVLINGTPAPLIYVSDRYHAAVVPFGIQGASAEITVNYNNAVSNTITVALANTAPGLFAADMTGSGPGAIQNVRNGVVTYNSAADPAAPGEHITLWLTGLGGLNPSPVDGWKVTGAPLPALQHPVSVTIGGRTADITYQGPGPEQVAGMYQINCVIPTGTPAGPAAVMVTADGRSSQPNLTVAVK